jgi:uncharacterized protein
MERATPAEIEKNRRRYEELKAQAREALALPPATARDGVPLDPARIIGRETIPSGWYRTMELSRGEALRLVNPEGTAAIALFAWNRDDPSERFNHADTVKVQWTAALGKGRLLLSDMGRVMLSIVEDTSGAHDALAGGSHAASNEARYTGGPHRNTRDNAVLAAAKHGLSARDVGSCLTFFAPVGTDGVGTFVWHEGRRARGDFVDLRAEMNLIVALSNCPHPLDPAPAYAPGNAELIRFRAPDPGPDDLCRTATAEAGRAFENTDALFRAAGALA